MLFLYFCHQRSWNLATRHRSLRALPVLPPKRYIESPQITASGNWRINFTKSVSGISGTFQMEESCTVRKAIFFRGFGFPYISIAYSLHGWQFLYFRYLLRFGWKTRMFLAKYGRLFSGKHKMARYVKQHTLLSNSKIAVEGTKRSSFFSILLLHCSIIWRRLVLGHIDIQGSFMKIWYKTKLHQKYLHVS